MLLPSSKNTSSLSAVIAVATALATAVDAAVTVSFDNPSGIFCNMKSMDDMVTVNENNWVNNSCSGVSALATFQLDTDTIAGTSSFPWVASFDAITVNSSMFMTSNWTCMMLMTGKSPMVHSVSIGFTPSTPFIFPTSSNLVATCTYQDIPDPIPFNVWEWWLTDHDI